jgi:hypothetical protein
MVCASPNNAVIVARASCAGNDRIEHMLYERGVGKRHVAVPLPQAIYGIRMEGPYDLYVDEPWHKENLTDILTHFGDARRVVMIGTPDEKDGDKEATRIWWDGMEWSNVNYLANKRGIPRYTGDMTLADRIIAEVTRLRDDINRNPYTDVTLKAQDGRVVLTEITSKHNPA